MEAEMTQTTLGQLLGLQGEQRAQSRIAKYEGGQVPPPETLAAIDRALGRPLGYVLRLAGLIEDAQGVEDMVRADPDLIPSEMDTLLLAYRAAVRRSTAARRAGSADATTSPTKPKRERS